MNKFISGTCAPREQQKPQFPGHGRPLEHGRQSLASQSPAAEHKERCTKKCCFLKRLFFFRKEMLFLRTLESTNPKFLWLKMISPQNG